MSLFKILKGDSSRISTDTTPFHDGWCYFTSDDGGFYIDSLEENGAEKRTQINVGSRLFPATLTASGWADGSQTISLDEVTANRNGYVCIAQDATDAQFDAAKNADLSVKSQGDGALVIKATGETPSLDIPVCVILFP